MKYTNFKIFLCFLFFLGYGSSLNPCLHNTSNTIDISKSSSHEYDSRETGLKLVGQVGGSTQAVAVKGKYAYVGVGMRMIVLNVSDLSRIKQVGATKVMDGFVTGISVLKSRAYITAGGAGLYIVNISNPRRPKVMGFYDSPGYPENVYVKGKYAYVADGWAGLQVVDISKDKKPRKVGSISTVGYAFDVVVDSDIAYIATAGAGLKVVDVKNPARPVEIGEYNTPGYAYGLALSGKKKIVYVADGWEGVRIIDVSNPYQPESMGSYKTPGWAFGIAAEKNTIYVADAFKGLRVIDVSSPSKPKELGSYEIEGHTHTGRLFVKKNIVYIADKNSGLRVIDVSKKRKPIQKTFFDFMEFASGVTVIGNYICIAAGRNGFQVIDVSDPSNIREVGSFETQSYAWSVDTDGRYAYVAAHGELYVMDITNPSDPKKIGYYQERGAFRYIVIKRGVAYIANEYGLLLIDVTDPSNPNKLGYIELMEWPKGGHFSMTEGVDVYGKFAYVVGGLIGIKIVDVSNPKNPKLIGQFKDMGYNNNVAAAENYAYTVGGDGLTVFDVSNPRQIKKLGVYPTPGNPEGVTVKGNVVYISDGGGGLLMVDVSNPNNPILIGRYNTPGYAQDTYVRQSSIYVADQDGGVQILEKATAIDLNRGLKNLDSSNKRNDIIMRPGRDTRSNRYSALPYCRIHSASSHFRGIDFITPKNKIIKDFFLNKKNTQQFSSIFRSSKKLIVTNPKDSGPDSLRWCMEKAKKGDTITFDSSVFPSDNPTTISLLSEIPSITQGNITIDASNAGVILNGKKISGHANGIPIYSDGNKIKGLQILSFPGCGIWIKGDGNIIGGDRTKGKGPVGQGNVLSGNEESGIVIDDWAKNNKIIGNLIGTDVSGRKGLGNKSVGVWIHGQNNTIGGKKPGERNIISGNGFHGVYLSTSKCSGNIVIGNYIGTDVSGTSLLSNKMHGVSNDLGAFNNTIMNNVIVTEGQVNICINDAGSSYNVIIGNLIGTDATGRVLLRKGGSGSVWIGMGAEFNRIGGTNPEERNVINVEGGIQFARQSASGNLVLGNFIGTDISGMKSIGKLKEGLRIGSGSRRPFVGGVTEEERNVFGNFEWSGITIDQTADHAWIAGNYIGVGADGETPLSKDSSGISVNDNTEHNIIQGNLFSGDSGIDLSGGKNVVVGNTFKKARYGLAGGGTNNLIYKNKFIENEIQATDSGNNKWDRNGAGNYWSDYKGTDEDGDGIGDTPYHVHPNGVDHYPLMNPSNSLTVYVNPRRSGTISITPSKSSYSFGEYVQLNATPKSGYAFSSWTGDYPAGQERKNPITLTMNTDKSVTANFVSSTASFLTLSKRHLNFAAIKGGRKTPDQEFSVVNRGGEVLGWQITDSTEWLVCSPSVGAGDALVTVSVDPEGLSVGTYIATLYITSVDPEGSQSMQTVAVTLEVITLDEAGMPFGEWDKPLETSSSYSGCFVFSGWALDRVGIESVKIYRLKVLSDDPILPDEIFVGNAWFVESGRPDIEESYAHFPQCSRAGWGYNFVSDILSSDEEYTFTVRVRSVYGREVELGRKTINIENLSSFIPYGTLDIPEPGGRMYGDRYHIAGWGKGKKKSHIAEVDLYIDSVYRKSMSLGFPRPDLFDILFRRGEKALPGFIATIYPNHLSNGYHTAFLIAEDSDGRKAVLGSRWFSRSSDKQDESLHNINNSMSEALGFVKIRKEYGQEIKGKQRKRIEYVEEKVVIRLNELKNIALKDFSKEGKDIFYRALYREQELFPLGMSFNEKKGIISWLPIPGFRGEFPVEILKFKNSVLNGKRRIVFYVK